MDSPYSAGFKAECLICISFLPDDDPQAFGFIKFNDVLYASHIMPAYVYGQMSDILPLSIFRRSNENDMDWAYYYMDMYILWSLFCILNLTGIQRADLLIATCLCSIVATVWGTAIHKSIHWWASRLCTLIIHRLFLLITVPLMAF